MNTYKDVLPKTEAMDMIEELFEAERITLTDWEEEFLQNIFNAPIHHLSPKQTAKLWDIYNKKLG